jgi:hypothetical protein
VGSSKAAGVIPSLALAWAAMAAPAPARADPRCTGTTATGGRFAACFDPGNRLFVHATTAGTGGGIVLRHALRFDDEPDLVWKLEHRVLVAHVRTSGPANHLEAVAYAGRYLRHARDGHVVIPFSVGRKLFLPFDVGADAEAGRISALAGDARLEVGVVRTAALIDLSRSESFRRRLCVGALIRWDVQMDREPLAIAEHVVAPLSAGVIDAHAESKNGLTAADLRFEGGKAWSSAGGWRTDLWAELSLERILVAINDRPLSVILGARYRTVTEELRAQIGVRFALFQRLHRQVVLDSLELDAPE